MVKNKKALEIGRNILCVICIVGIALTYYGYSINQMPIAVCGLGVSTISGTCIYFVISHIKKKEKETKNENEQQSLYEITSKTAKVEVELSENSQQKNELYEKLNFSQKKFISHINILEEKLNKNEQRVVKFFQNTKNFNKKIVDEFIKPTVLSNIDTLDFVENKLKDFFDEDKYYTFHDFYDCLILSQKAVKLLEKKEFSSDDIRRAFRVLKFKEYEKLIYEYNVDINWNKITFIDDYYLTEKFIQIFDMDIDQLDVIKKDNFITKDLQLLYCEDSIEKGKQLEAYLESDDISRDIRYDKTKWDALYKICQQEKMYIKQYVLIKVMEYFRWCDKAFKNKEFIQLIKNAFIEYGDFKTVAMNTYSLYNDEYSYSISRYVSLMDYIMFLYFLQRRIFIQKNYEELKNKYTEINWEEFITSKKMTTYICNNAHKYRNCYQDLIDICNYYILNKVSISDYLFTKEYLWDIDYIKNTILKSEFLDNENNYIKIMDIDIMSGIDFEEFLGKLFRRMGYESVVTPASGDYGIDLLVKKDNQTVAVQAKRYSESNVVGIKAVQEALGGKSYYKADKAMVITTSSFTKNAQNLAKENGIILWDRHELKKKIDDLF